MENGSEKGMLKRIVLRVFNDLESMAKEHLHSPIIMRALAAARSENKGFELLPSGPAEAEPCNCGNSACVSMPTESTVEKFGEIMLDNTAFFVLKLHDSSMTLMLVLRELLGEALPEKADELTRLGLEPSVLSEATEALGIDEGTARKMLAADYTILLFMRLMHQKTEGNLSEIAHRAWFPRDSRIFNHRVFGDMTGENVNDVARLNLGWLYSVGIPGIQRAVFDNEVKVKDLPELWDIFPDELRILNFAEKISGLPPALANILGMAGPPPSPEEQMLANLPEGTTEH